MSERWRQKGLMKDKLPPHVFSLTMASPQGLFPKISHSSLSYYIPISAGIILLPCLLIKIALSITCHERNANQNHEISPHFYESDHYWEKKKTETSVIKAMEEKEASYTVGRNEVTWSTLDGNNIEFPQNIKSRYAMWFSNSMLRYLSEEMKPLIWRYICTPVLTVALVITAKIQNQTKCP